MLFLLALGNPLRDHTGCDGTIVVFHPQVVACKPKHTTIKFPLRGEQRGQPASLRESCAAAQWKTLLIHRAKRVCWQRGWNRPG